MKPATGNWQLKPLNLPDLPALIALSGEGLTLGRDVSNAVVFPQDRYPHVSSFHARILLDAAGVPVLEDLGSSNGSLVNGKETDKSTLKRGDVLQLGRGVGPRFLVVDHADMAATISVPAGKVRSSSDVFGATTILHLKKVLGLPQGEVPLRTVFRARNRRLVVLFALFFVLLLGGFGIGAYYLKTARQEDLAQVKELNRQLQDRLDRSRRELRARLERSQQELSSHHQLWEQEKLRLEKERTSLKVSIASLEAEERIASGEIGRLRSQLSDTSEKLAKYKPVDLGQEAKARQEILEQSLAAVVFIEKRVTFQDQKSGALLHGRKTIAGWVDSCFTVPNFMMISSRKALLPRRYPRSAAPSSGACSARAVRAQAASAVARVWLDFSAAILLKNGISAADTSASVARWPIDGPSPARGVTSAPAP